MEDKLDQVKLTKNNHDDHDAANNADDSGECIMEEEDEADLTNLAWLTELRNQRHKAWHNGLNNFEKTLTTNTKTFKEHEHENNEHDYDYGNDDDDDDDNNNTARTTIEQLNVKIKQKKTIATPNFTKNPNTIYQFQQQNNKQQHLENNQKRPIKRPTPMERFEIFCKKIKRDFEEYEKSAEHFQSVENEKPPFNYSHIIGMAMLEKGRVTLQQICTWIEYRFAYFRLRKKWNNSIRHNLSLHPCFRKIERKKYEKGKGGYWELGIDLKKCDRKRIRHRKSNSLQQLKQKQQQQLHNQRDQQQGIEKEMISLQNNSTNNNNNNDDFFHEMHGIIIEPDEELVLTENAHDDEIEAEEEQEEEFTLKHICMNLESEAEKDLIIHDDDDLDVQHNIHTSSTSRMNYNNNHSLNEEEEQQMQQQEYQLGTIIISTTATATTSTNQEEIEQQYATDEKEDEDENIAAAHNCFVGMTQQQQRDYFINHQINTEDVNNIIMDSEGPNVIVEEIEQQQQHLEHYSLINNYHVATLLSPLSNNNNNNRNINTTVNHNNNNTDNNIEIDSIEEAFQYLRSLDHYNREDTLLDHLFDVSVSDF